ncbi:MAG: arginine repressor [Acidimicrobiales bacterium]
MKAERQRRIARLISQQAVGSQAQLVRLLASSGYGATQATVSRDLEELGALKARRNGRVAYVLPEDAPPAPVGEALQRLLAGSVLGLEASGNLLLVRTPPGHAGMVAGAIDRASLKGVAGTVAGDDTILVVCKQEASPRGVERLLRGLMKA